MEVIGRHGTSLDEVRNNGSYAAISIPDFPNLSMVSGPNGPVGNFSLIEVAALTAWPRTFDRFREEMRKPRLSGFEMG